MKDIPAFVEEDYMTTRDNYLSRIDYELKEYMGFDGVRSTFTKSWKTVDKELKSEPNVGNQLSKSVKLTNYIGSDLIGEKDKLKKAKGIYEYVQNHYTWNKKYKIFKDVSIKDVNKDKSGNVSGINILLHNLLKEACVEVKPVLLSTRKNGMPTTIYPVISDFNYLIVQATIKDKTYLLDATDKYISFGQIPFRCLNQIGRLLDFKNGSEWIDIKPNGLSTSRHHVNLKFTEDALISGTLKSEYTGYHALPKKQSYYGNPSEYLEDFENKHYNLEVVAHEVKSQGKTEEKFQESFQIEFNKENGLADKIYLDPFAIKFFTKNPFQLQQRTYPIDFGYKDNYIYSFEIDLKDMFEVIDLPRDINVTIPNNKGNFKFVTKVEGTKISLFFKIAFNQAIYLPEYYPYLKKFMSRVVDAQTNSLIVLQKK